MPIAASTAGTLTRVAAGGSAALGALSVVGYAENPALGTLEVDRTLFLAFYARVRLTRPDVYVDDELMANLVDTVSIEESLEDPIRYATFTLSDERVAFFDAATLSNGERSVDIDLWAGPPGAVMKWTAFAGNTEGATNNMPYRPRGTFRTISLAAKWADVTGCLNVPALSGLHRGAILVAFAESAGVPIANAGELQYLGAVVTKKIDIAGVTPFDLIREFGEIEGWFARATEDGAGLEVISEDRMLDGAPVFAFDESNYSDVPEATPERPVTNWILSTTRLTQDPESAAVAAGNVSTATGGTSGGAAAGSGGVGPPGPAGPPGASGAPGAILTSTGGSPTIAGPVDATNTTFTTSVNASVASIFIVYVDGMPDFDATWSGTALTPSSAPLTSIRVMYWS